MNFKHLREIAERNKPCIHTPEGSFTTSQEYLITFNPQTVLELLDTINEIKRALKELHGACSSDEVVGAWESVSHARAVLKRLEAK